MAMCIARFGIDWELEEQATALLVKDRKDRGIKGVRANSEEYCWLTNTQLEFRQRREVYTEAGFPDPSINEGRVFRAYNPLFGTRPARQSTERG